MQLKIINCIRSFFMLLGILFLFLIALSFTPIPYHAYHQLAATDISLNKKPTAIVVLSGVGMPSPDALIKLYFAKKAALNYPKSKVYLLLPELPSKDSRSPILLMKKELIDGNVHDQRIQLITEGHNTYSQLHALSGRIDTASSVLVVTTPEHMRRSILTFNKMGYQHVGGLPTFEHPSSESLLTENANEELEISNLSLRYNVWSYLQYEIIVIREYCALGYYWLKGWI